MRLDLGCVALVAEQDTARDTGFCRYAFAFVLPHQHHTVERRRVVWVLLQNQLLRCSVHSVRPTTSLEQTQFEINNKEDISKWRSLSDLLPKKEFIDINQEEPGPDEREQPDLPDQPNSSTTYRPTRRLWTKTKPPPAASSSGLPRDAADVNVYEPDSKKPRLDGQDDLMHDQRSYDLRWLEDPHLHQGDQHALLMASSDTMTIELDLDVSELSQRQQKNIQRDASASLVKKMRDSEVVYSRLTNDLKEVFNRAKTKEVSSFKAAAVRKALNSEEVREAFGQGRIMRARWVLTWKPTPPGQGGSRLQRQVHLHQGWTPQGQSTCCAFGL